MEDKLAQAKQTRILEMEKAFVQAMKDSKFEDALRFARTVQELDPGTTRFKEFIPLLEEKVSNDEEDEETSSGEEEDAANGEEAATNGEEDDSDDSEEDEDEESGSGDDEESEVAVEVVDSIALDGKNMKMTKQERSKLREGLRLSIQDLKEKEVIEKLKASDPLLG